MSDSVVTVGAEVVINKCDACPAIVGKTAKVKGFNEDSSAVSFNFGRGRPQANRPEFVNVDDVSLVEEK